MEWVVLADEIVSDLPKGRGYLADKLQRAGLSIPLNIAEGAGEFSKAEKARFYRMARRSAAECAAIVHVCLRLNLLDEHRYEQSHALLDRISAMLTKMVRSRR